MKRKLVFGVLLLAMATLLSTQVSAYQIGIRAGDNLSYEYDTLKLINGEAQPPTAGALWKSNITITHVTGTMLTISETLTYHDISQTNTVTITSNISPSSGGFQDPNGASSWFCVPANLSAGYLFVRNDYFFNLTEYRTVLGFSREVNVFSQSMNGDINQTIELVYDRETGILISQHTTVKSKPDSNIYETRYEQILTGANMFGGNNGGTSLPTTMMLFVGAIAAVAVVAAIFLIRMRKK